MPSKLFSNQWVVGLIVFVLTIVIYRLWLPVTYSGDDLQYTMLIQRHALGEVFYHPAAGQPYISQSVSDGLKIAPSAPPINPRYLFEWPTSVLAVNLWKLFGWQGESIVPIQAIRILVGALGVTLFFFALGTLINKLSIRLIATSGLGIGVAYWTYSTHQDQSINMVALLAGAFWVFAWQFKHGITRGRMLGLLVLLALASLYNFTAAMSAAAFGFGIALISPNQSLWGRFRVLVGFGVAYVVMVLGVIALAVLLFAPSGSLLSADFWQDAVFAGKPEYNINLVNDTLRAFLAIGKSQVLFPGVPGSLNAFFQQASQTERITLLGFYGAVLVFMALPLLYLIMCWRSLGRTRLLVGFLVVWLAAHSLFNWFWDPGFDKYWLIPLMAIWAMVVVALHQLQQQQSGWYRLAASVAAGFVLVSFVLNLFSQFMPESRPDLNPWLTISKEMQTASNPQDLFITTDHQMAFYMTYFGRRNVLATTLISYDSAGDTSRVSSVVNRMRSDHLADNGSIYIFGLESMMAAERQEFMQLIGDGELIAKWTYDATTIYEFVSST